jgi:hypothetical protein
MEREVVAIEVLIAGRRALKRSARLALLNLPVQRPHRERSRGRAATPDADRGSRYRNSR